MIHLGNNVYHGRTSSGAIRIVAFRPAARIAAEDIPDVDAPAPIAGSISDVEYPPAKRGRIVGSLEITSSTQKPHDAL